MPTPTHPPQPALLRNRHIPPRPSYPADTLALAYTPRQWSLYPLLALLPAQNVIQPYSRGLIENPVPASPTYLYARIGYSVFSYIAAGAALGAGS